MQISDTSLFIGSIELHRQEIGNKLMINMCFIICLFPQANCIDSTAQPAAVFAEEVRKMQGEKMKPQEQLTLEPYERDHAVVVGVYR